MAAFKPFEINGEPMRDQFMGWWDMTVAPYDADKVDAYTRTRVILMNGIENNSVLTSHAMERLIKQDDIRQALAYIRRADSMQQQVVNWLNPANQSVAAMAIAYEQTEVELTANLAQNEPDKYFHQVLDFALLEDFDHLFRYGCLLSLVENKDPNDITQGKTEFKPGRPTIAEHRHPFDEMRKCYDKDKATLKTKMNYHTIVSAEQETMLFYKSHGFMYADNLARGLFTEIADVEQQHVTQYELVGDPRETPLEKMAILQLCEAYNYYCCAITETDPCLAKLWDRFCEMEITHFNLCAKLMADFEKRDIRDVMGADTIESLIAFEPNKHYINRVLHDQTNLQPLDLAFVDTKKLPEDWASFGFRETVNNGGVPSEDVVQRAMDEGKLRAA